MRRPRHIRRHLLAELGATLCILAMICASAALVLVAIGEGVQ